jgi:DNA-directed RNA polymerase specialized sigma24 family protein
MTAERIDAVQQDAYLVAAAAAGDQASWDELVNRYAQFVWDAARRCNLDPALAADVCVVTWLRCADHLDDLLSGCDLRQWLTSSVAREAGDVLLASSPAPGGVSGTVLEHVVERRRDTSSERAG